ncbi:uncharacterized protein LOC121388017 [Gigantopelta aegis]|uniref:uncharacterized protein LOC121388017 n=1 Tax=Gigantopelta aegis TaxID=1735272 RepID=UPI001B8891AC|nr:uncharacterized protein LOC121388017 [Gigantopelta aegis]
MGIKATAPSRISPDVGTRTCMELFKPTATVTFNDIQEMFMMSYSTLRRMRYTELEDRYTFEIFWIGSVSAVFPGFLTNVDAATECYGNYTVLFFASSASCFSRNGSIFTAESCPTDLFTAYFSESGFSDLHAITSVDKNFHSLYVFRNNVAYQLLYDESGTRYLLNSSLPITDSDSPWAEAPDGLSAVCYFQNDYYFMFEAHKWYVYFSSPTKRISQIAYVCN